MTTRTKVLVGAAVLLVAGYAYAQRKKTLTCGAGARFVPTTNTDGWSGAVAQQIRDYGGYCARGGFVEDADSKPYSDDEPGLDEMEDPTLITHPWQLP